MKTMKILLIACLVFLIPRFSSGENSAAFFRCYYDELNLPQTTILSIYQDSKGYIWLATGKGVYRFDGYRPYPCLKYVLICGMYLRFIHLG